jgi:hypothetical protein
VLELVTVTTPGFDVLRTLTVATPAEAGTCLSAEVPSDHVAADPPIESVSLNIISLVESAPVVTWYPLPSINIAVTVEELVPFASIMNGLTEFDSLFAGPCVVVTVAVDPVNPAELQLTFIWPN